MSASEFTPLLGRMMSGAVLSAEEVGQAVDAMVSGSLEPLQAAAFLGALQARGATGDELGAMAEAMRRHAMPCPTDGLDPVDTAGTGGDGLSTFNFSTAAAIVAAGAGAPVAKHGNVSSSSKCGSADVLRELGVPLDFSPADAAECLRQTGFTFLFAPHYHPAARHLAPVRKALKVRTAFNLLGPLLNPARVRRQVVGVYSDSWVHRIAEALAFLQVERGLVVHGHGGMDEFSLSGPSRVVFIESGAITADEVVDPADLGLAKAQVADVVGGEPEENAAMMRAVLGGQAGARLDGTLYNAAATLWAAGIVDEIGHGLGRARDAVESGRALGVLDAVVEFGRRRTGAA